MKSNLQICPGNSLESFLKYIAYDLKFRRIEYLVIAYFNESGIPLGMRQITGRTSWVECSIEEIITDAEHLHAKGISLVHNHPASAQQKPELAPSAADIEFQKTFMAACHDQSFRYLGCWIVSKGHLSEILYQTRQTSLREEGGQLRNLADLAFGLTPELIQTIEQLTKPLILVYDWHTIGKIKGKSDFVAPPTLRVKARLVSKLNGVEPFAYQVLLTTEKDKAETTEILSLEEASRACYGLSEISQEAGRLLASKTVEEYLEAKLFASDNVYFGFYIQKGSILGREKFDHSAFMVIRGTHFFMNVEGFGQLHELLSTALDKLESLGGSIKQTQPDGAVHASTA